MQRIFHYTTLETLKIILTNKTIRLNSLSKMDDLIEGYSPDFAGMSHYYFTSSWSYDNEENIPLWYMYTNKMQGVRIEVDSDLLVPITDEKRSNITNITNSNSITAFEVKYLKGNFLSKVKYTDEYHSAISGARGYINENILDTGIIKPKAWEFQKEIRFTLQALKTKDLMKLGDTLFQRFKNSIINEVPSDLEYIDMIFDINKLSNANFILGPASSKIDLEELEQMVELIPNYKGQISTSKLKIRYKEK